MVGSSPWVWPWRRGDPGAGQPPSVLVCDETPAVQTSARLFQDRPWVSGKGFITWTTSPHLCSLPQIPDTPRMDTGEAGRESFVGSGTNPQINPDGYRQGWPSILCRFRYKSADQPGWIQARQPRILCRFRYKSADKIFLLAATAVPQWVTEVLQSGRTTTPDLAGQPADVQQGRRLAPPVPMCWVPFSGKAIPRSVRCSCGFFF